MNIGFSKNSFWEDSIFTEEAKEPGTSASKVDAVLEKGWSTWKPAFVTDHAQPNEFKKMESWANLLRKNRRDHLIVIGMGGSALGAKAIRQYGFQNHSKVFFWEGAHPSLLKEYSKLLENQRSAVLWISKSGTTLESRVNIAVMREFFGEVPEYFVTSRPEKISDLCTDPKRIFHIPEKLGGRFSVISPVGIMPSLFMGADMQSFLNGFLTANDDYHISIPIRENRAKQAAYELFSLLSKNCYGLVFWIYSRELMAWGDWMVQLWAESLGKSPKVEAFPCLAKGPEDQHSLLQFFQEGPNKFAHIFCHTKSYAPFNAKLSEKHSGVFANHTLWEILQAQVSGTELALTEAKRPVCEYLFPQIYKNGVGTIEPDLALMGRWMGYWMYVVTYVGYLYGVNPFDQPGVERGKEYCSEILASNSEKTPFQENFEI